MKELKNGVKVRNIIFALNGVFAPKSGEEPKISREKITSAMDYLKKLQKKGDVVLYLIAGQNEEKTTEKIGSLGLSGYFEPKNIFFVDNSYIESKQEIDRERHVANLQADPDFVDEYFKQRVIADLIASGKIFREDSILIGRDIFFDAFYTSRFSGIDFALVKECLTERGNKSDEIAGWMNLIDFTAANFEKIVNGKMPKPDPKVVETFVMNKLKREFMQTADFSNLVKKIAEKQAEKRQNN